MLRGTIKHALLHHARYKIPPYYLFHVSLPEETKGTVDCAYFTRAFEMGDP
jgi:hypothetical protein